MLSTPSFRKTAKVVPASAAIADVLHACFLAASAATWYDGTARTAGVDTNTWTEVLVGGTVEAAYGVPWSANPLGLRQIIAGRSLVPAPAPTYRTPDAWTNSAIWGSINLASGAFATWNAALPFTAGRFFGYWKFSLCATLTIVNVWYYEDVNDGLICGFVLETSVNTCCVINLGRIGDPDSTDALDGESDAALYGVTTSGAVAINTAASSTYTAFPGHGTSDGEPHWGVFQPTLSTIFTIARAYVWSVAATANTWKKLSGRWVTVPIEGQDSVNGWWKMYFRGIEYAPIGVDFQRLRVGGVDYGYFFGASAIAADDGYVLRR